MIQQEDGAYLGCRCPECFYRCDACMGTDTVLTREEIARFRTEGTGRLDDVAKMAEEDTAAEDMPTEETDEKVNGLWTNG